MEENELYQESLTYAADFVLVRSGFGGAFPLTVLAIIVILIWIRKFTKAKWTKRSHHIAYWVSVFILGGIVYAHAMTPTEESMEQYKSAYAVWHKEYAEEIIKQLPKEYLGYPDGLQRVEKIPAQSISQQHHSASAKPLLVVDATGREVKLWATVVIDETLTKDIVEYKRLERELSFGEPLSWWDQFHLDFEPQSFASGGFYQAAYYTPEPIK